MSSESPGAGGLIANDTRELDGDGGILGLDYGGIYKRHTFAESQTIPFN